MADSANVFISYASDTKPLAEELTKELESHGIEPWVDFKDLLPGQRWREEVERAISDAHWLVILVRSGSRTTPWLDTEWSAALADTWEHRDKQLLPVVFGHDDPPPFLRDWVPLRVNPDTEASTWTGRVLNVLRRTKAEFVHDNFKHRKEFQSRLKEIEQAAHRLREVPLDDLRVR